MLSTLSGHISTIMDVAGLDKIVNVEADYDITSFFSSEIQHHLKPLIDYRIKLLLKIVLFFTVEKLKKLRQHVF